MSSIRTTRSPVLAISASSAFVGDQDIGLVGDRDLQRRRLQPRHDAVGDIIIEREDSDGGLADREGRCCDDRRQQPLEPLPAIRQLGRDARAPCMNLGADMMGDQPNDPLTVSR